VEKKADGAVQLNVLTHGDSYTRGFYASGMLYSPYADVIQNLLSEAEIPAEVVESGVNGETTDSMLGRLKDNLAAVKITYDVVCLLGGLNDLAYKKTSVEIVKNLCDMASVAVEHGAKCVCLSTIPTNKLDRNEDLKEISLVKLEANRMLRDRFGPGGGSGKQQAVVLVDMAKVVDAVGMQGEEVDAYFSDNLHYSPKAYELIGKSMHAVIMARCEAGGLVLPHKLLEAPDDATTR